MALHTKQVNIPLTSIHYLLQNSFSVKCLDPGQDRHKSVLIWLQTVCKGFQQMTKVTASKERDNIS